MDTGLSLAALSDTFCVVRCARKTKHHVMHACRLQCGPSACMQLATCSVLVCIAIAAISVHPPLATFGCWGAPPFFAHPPPDMIRTEVFYKGRSTRETGCANPSERSWGHDPKMTLSRDKSSFRIPGSQNLPIPPQDS